MWLLLHLQASTQKSPSSESLVGVRPVTFNSYPVLRGFDRCTAFRAKPASLAHPSGNPRAPLQRLDELAGEAENEVDERCWNDDVTGIDDPLRRYVGLWPDARPCADKAVYCLTEREAWCLWAFYHAFFMKIGLFLIQQIPQYYLCQFISSAYSNQCHYKQTAFCI